MEENQAQPATFTEEEYALHVTIRRVASILYEEVGRENRSLWLVVSQADRPIMPFFHQTSTGIFLAEVENYLYEIWTPWGVWQFLERDVLHSADLWPVIMGRFFRRVDTTLYTQTRLLSVSDAFRPVYALNTVEDVSLPYPVEREKSEFLPDDLAIQVWNAMSARYYAERNRP